jgi:phage gp29-like protein
MKKPDTKTMTAQIITNDFLGSFLGFMPNPDDIVSGTLESYNTYRKMLTDGRIKSLLNKKKTSSLIFPASFIQGDKCPSNIYKFIKDIPLFQNLYRKEKRMLSSLNYGFSISEIVWDDPSGNGGKWIPGNIITRRPERFEFDKDWNLYWREYGIKQKLDQSYKFLQMQHDPDDENPYGTSELRSAYWPWMFKTAGFEFWLQATERFSVDSIIALFSSEGDPDTIQKKADSIAQMLMGLQSGSTAAVGNVTDIKDISMAGKLSDFNTLVDACDIQISYALTGQSIATNKTDGGSLALGEVQSDMLYEDCKGIALEVQSAIQKLVDWVVELNFGPGSISPLYQFDIGKKASFEQLIKAIQVGIPVSKQSVYDGYGIQKPLTDDDTFVMQQQTAAGLTLTDPYTTGKKKILKTRREITFSN